MKFINNTNNQYESRGVSWRLPKCPLCQTNFHPEEIILWSDYINLPGKQPNTRVSVTARNETNQFENNEVKETQDERENSIISRRIQGNNRFMTTYARSANSSNDNTNVVDFPEEVDFIFADKTIDEMCILSNTGNVIRHIP